MTSPNRIEMQQYAVISVRTIPYCEQLVIEYPDEKTLRNFVAASSIVALGYSSREEVEASSWYSGTPAQPLQRRSIAKFVFNCRKALKEWVSNYLLAQNNYGFQSNQSAVYCLLQQSFITAILVFYSKNALSAAIRGFISS